MGAKVIAVVGSEEKAKALSELGVTGLINYRTGDLKEKIKALTGGRGVDVVYSAVHQLERPDTGRWICQWPHTRAIGQSHAA